MVVGINTAFSSRKRRDSVRATWMLQVKVPPAPPPPPAARCWDAAPLNGLPELVAPSRKVVVQNVGPERGSLGNSESKNEENLKPKLKPLHWDKVRASSDRAMVWDQLKSSSFQLNEEMIETLFMVNTNGNAKDGVRRPMILEAHQENLVLDPKKSHNIAILLKRRLTGDRAAGESTKDGSYERGRAQAKGIQRRATIQTW